MKINIDTQTETRLNEIASSANRSPEALASDMLTLQIQDEKQALYWKERAEDRTSLESMKKGEYISQQDMFTKIDTLIEEAKTLA